MTEPLYCVNHPKTETYLRCNKCGRPICAKCARRTPVGYRCRDCIEAQQQVFYSGFAPVHYLIAAAVALLVGLVAGVVIPSLGWFAIVLGPLAGGGIAEAARWAIKRRRGKHVWLVVCACIAAGWLPRLLMALLPLLFISPVTREAAGLTATGLLLNAVWDVVYLVTAIGAAYARLRPGRQV